jgi:hypothetical protein
MKNEILVCNECGSSESIQIKVWNYVNSKEFASDCSDDSDDRWCEVCEEHVNFITKEEWENEKK